MYARAAMTQGLIVRHGNKNVEVIWFENACVNWSPDLSVINSTCPSYSSLELLNISAHMMTIKVRTTLRSLLLFMSKFKMRKIDRNES